MHTTQNILGENNYLTLINNSARVDRGSSSCIDHIFVKGKCDTNYHIQVITDQYTIINATNIKQATDLNDFNTKRNRRKQIKRINVKAITEEIRGTSVIQVTRTDNKPEYLLET